MQLYPNVSFTISVEKDLSTFYAFVTDAEYDDGENIKWAILKPYPQLSEWFDQNKLRVSKKVVVDFINTKYKEKENEMKHNLIQVEERWKDIAPKYFELVRKLDFEVKWPDGKYICYPTIWGMYPRFLDDKTFQIPWKHERQDYAQIVIAHELLHFIWYEYFYSTHLEYKSGQDDMYVWNISEIFNSFIQGLPAWVGLFNGESMPYPQHSKILDELKIHFGGKPQLTASELTQEILKHYKV